jgi:predicted CXXCH cytochrome family protein
LLKILTALALIVALFTPGCRNKDQSNVLPQPDLRKETAASSERAQYVGRENCKKCHQKEYNLFRGSDHDMAMDIASDSTVLGDFNNAAFTHFGITSRFYTKDGKYYVYTEGPGGKFEEYELKYTFGIRPLQQYLVEFPGGRMQCLPLCWDTRPKQQGGQRWFHIYDRERIPPNDILFWTHTAQNWNYMCAECHSTNLKKNFDYKTETYNSTWSEIDVSCEACHGPGSEHVEWAEAVERGENPQRFRNMGLKIRLKDDDQGAWVFKDMQKGTAERTVPRTSDVLIDMCARCHSRRSSLTDDYAYGKSILNSHNVSLLEERLYFPDGQILEEVYVYASFLQSKMHRAGVICTDCHEPHSGRVYVQGNALCYRCHLTEKYGTRRHHFHKPDSTGSGCFDCHMPERTYMVVDPRRDHSIRLPRPDLSEKLNVPNACNQCHTDKPVRWAIETMEKWYGPFKNRPEHYGETIWAGRRSYPEALPELITLAENKDAPVMVRATVISLLRNYANPNTIPVLQSALKNPQPLIRAAAADAMEILSPGDRAQLLTPALQDSIKLVRITAARQLAEVSNSNLSPKNLQLRNKNTEEYIRMLYTHADNPSAYLNVGVLYLRQNDYPKTEAAYKKAIENEPYFPGGYINLADLYRMQDREAEGEKVLLSGLEKNPDAAVIHHALGLLLVRKKKTDPALNFLAKAAELEPENARYCYVYAVGLNSTGKSDQAVAELEKALPHNPYDRDLLFALTAFHRDRGELDKALAYADKLISSFPQDPNYRQLKQQLETLRDQGGQ